MQPTFTANGPSHPYRAPRSPREVLLIEDDPVSAMIQLRYLAAEGFSPHLETSVEGALSYLKGHRVELIVTDLQFGEDSLSGMDFLLQAKRSEAGKGPPVIVVSGSTDKAAQEASYQRGASAYLRKPFLAGEYREALRTGATLMRAPAFVSATTTPTLKLRLPAPRKKSELFMDQSLVGLEVYLLSIAGTALLYALYQAQLGFFFVAPPWTMLY